MATTTHHPAHTNGAETKIPTYPLIINGRPHPTSSSFAVYSPKTGTHLHSFSSASISDTDAAISAAEKAYPAWRALPPNQKRDIFLKAADIVESRAEEMQKQTVQEIGAAEGWAAFDHGISVQILRDIAGRISSLAGSIPATSREDVTALVYKEPYGVVLAIAPWNAPHILGVRSIAFPLAAGNTVILKAPEFSPMASTGIVQALNDAGLPPGTLNLIAHQPSDAAAVTKHLICHPGIKKINFTGSTNVGRIIAELAGKNLKPVLLELGGKAPAIVWEDADVELAAKECAVGAFLHAGQICMSTERVIVHERVAEKFEEAFKTAVAGFAPESSEAMILLNRQGLQKNQRLVKDAVDKGAIILHGDPSHPDEGTKMRPVVVKGTTKDMDLYYTESFGPTVSVMIVKTEEEALALANDTEYGLSAAVFTGDLQTGLRLARGIESGAVHINGMTVHDETALPHGGTKSSGYGRFGSHGLEEWVRTKTVTFKN